VTDGDWDLLVVGAGPAGSVAAREFARQGARVLLVDKASFPRAKVCGCCLNASALESLDEIGLGLIAKECGAVPLRAIRLASGRRSAEVPLPGGVAVSRAALDSALVREAEAAGAEFRSGVMVREQELAVSARVVILATGLAGAQGPVSPSSRIGAGVVVAAAAAPAFFTPGTISMAMGHGGHGRLVRIADDRHDVAAAFDARFVQSSGGLGAAAAAIIEG
jgi:flavin-dependent dehydrogenase